MKELKPREWWMFEAKTSAGVIWPVGQPHPPESHESEYVHVIEKSAYTELLARAEKLVAALEHADRYIDYAMEFDDTSKNTIGIECIKEALLEWKGEK